jgi:transposase-like protein
MRCTHCGNERYVRNGKKNGSQQYICKHCKRSFSDKVRKFTYADKERFLDMYLNNVGIRKAAKFIGCSPSLLIAWVKELASNLRRQLRETESDMGSDKLPEVIEMDEIYTRVKKGLIESKYGLLILGTEVKLLRF